MVFLKRYLNEAKPFEWIFGNLFISSISDDSMSTVNTSSFHSLAEEGNFSLNLGGPTSGHPNGGGSSMVSNGRLAMDASSSSQHHHHHHSNGDTTNFYSVLADRPTTTTDEDDDGSELVIATSTPIRRRDIINANIEEEDFNNRSPIKSMTQLWIYFLYNYIICCNAQYYLHLNSICLENGCLLCI